MVRVLNIYKSYHVHKSALVKVCENNRTTEPCPLCSHLMIEANPVIQTPPRCLLSHWCILHWIAQKKRGRSETHFYIKCSLQSQGRLFQYIFLIPFRLQPVGARKKPLWGDVDLVTFESTNLDTLICIMLKCVLLKNIYFNFSFHICPHWFSFKTSRWYPKWLLFKSWWRTRRSRKAGHVVYHLNQHSLP